MAQIMLMRAQDAQKKEKDNKMPSSAIGNRVFPDAPRLSGQQIPAMTELLTPPPLRSVPLTQADMNLISQMRNATQIGTFVTNAMLTVFAGLGVPLPQVMVGGGTHYNATANQIIYDDLDPRVDSNIVHETMHALASILNPLLPNGQPRRTYIIGKMTEEASAQIFA